METLENPTTLIARPQFKSHYDNFIGGKWVAPVKGQYFENPSPIDGKAFCKVARSTKEDIEVLNASWAASRARVSTGIHRAVFHQRVELIGVAQRNGRGQTGLGHGAYTHLRSHEPTAKRV